MTAVKRAATKATKRSTTKATAPMATAKKPTARKATARKATEKETAAKTPAKSPTAKKSTAKKSTAKKSTVKAASITSSLRASRPPSTRGAFAAGAARASGERQRRVGTPLLSTPEPVEVSPARRRARRSASASTVDVPTPVATEVAAVDLDNHEAMVATESPDALGTPPEPVVLDDVSSETTGPKRDTDPTNHQSTDTDTQPPRRKRPPRSAIRAERAAAGESKRLRAVPSNDDEVVATEASTPEPAERHTEQEAGGWEQAVTSRAERLVGAVLEAAEFSSEARPGPAELVELAVNVLRAAATSAGVPAEDVERQVAETLAYVRRRLSGDYLVDEFGFDEDYTVNVHLPLLRPLYRKWFRVEVRGIENIPSVGGALVVGNHSGTVAMDSLMTQVAVYDEHPLHRHLRMLGADLVFSTPVIGAMARRSGSTLAANSDAERLLRSGELVGVWPEGFKGIGKPFSERYKLQRFGRGGFVSAALRAGVPIVPVSIVGAEEIYPILGNMPTLARLLGMPYAPITPTFPWLGPLGMIPLPSKWLIEFGPPIDTASLGPESADDPMLVFDLTDQVRETIQQTLYSLLMQRKSVFV